MQTCIVCHGDRGQGGQHGGGVELTKALTIAEIMNTVGNGRNNMPAFGRVYKPDELHDIVHRGPAGQVARAAPRPWPVARFASVPLGLASLAQRPSCDSKKTTRDRVTSVTSIASGFASSPTTAVD